jgi:RND family efflux transporter MFP subunit
MLLMPRRLTFSFAPLLLLGLGLLGGGCNGRRSSEPPPVPPAVVQIAQLTQRDNLDFADFTGRTDAVQSVDVKARATGYLEKVMFVEGQEVKEGQQLYQIDDRTYKADLDKQKAEVNRLQAMLDQLNADLARAKRMRVGDAISREDFDKAVASRDSTSAQLASARASVRTAELNLEFTRVYSPIDGGISRTRITKGNLVLADQTLLTTVVSLDPIYAYYDADERTVLEVQQQIRKGAFKSYREAKFPVYLGTQIEKGFPHVGQIDFVESRLDPNTGTLRVRGVFPNKDRVLTPGLFVRIRVPLGQPHKAVVVSERALGSDQGQRFLYVVNDKDEVEYRAVQVGSLRDGMRVIESGAKAGEWVIVNGLQRVRPGARVEPKKVPMPGPTQPAPGQQGGNGTKS